jgi:hypothetical protein
VLELETILLQSIADPIIGGLLAWDANSPKSCNDSSTEKILVILPANSVQASTEIADAAIARMSTEIEAD